MAKMYNPPHAGELIAECMEALGIDKETLSRALDVNSATVQSVLDGETHLSANMADKIGFIVGISPDLLLRAQDAFKQWQASKQKR